MNAEEHLESLSVHLAANLRAFRHQRSMTQAQLARLCDLPRSTVASLEAGSGNPTLTVLTRLSLALRLSIEELLAPPRARCQLFPKGSLPVHEKGRRTVRISELLPHPIPGMQIDRMELRPGARLAGVPHQAGTHEYLACERGRLRLVVAGESFALGPGDVAAFPGDQAHSYHATSREPAVGFSVVTLRPVGTA